MPEEDDAISDDLVLAPLAAVLAIPGSGLEPTLDENLAALAEMLSDGDCTS